MVSSIQSFIKSVGRLTGWLIHRTINQSIDRQMSSPITLLLSCIRRFDLVWADNLFTHHHHHYVLTSILARLAMPCLPSRLREAWERKDRLPSDFIPATGTHVVRLAPFKGNRTNIYAFKAKQTTEAAAMVHMECESYHTKNQSFNQ